MAILPPCEMWDEHGKKSRSEYQRKLKVKILVLEYFLYQALTASQDPDLAGVAER